jgi:L-fucose isomerase-like protein
MSTAIYTLTSTLHDPHTVGALTKEFLNSLNIPYVLKGDDFSDYGTHELDLIFVRTGGTEGLFKQLLPQLVASSKKPFYLLASNKSNSLPAAMEILSFLRQQGLHGEILHGSPEYIAARIQQLNRMEEEVPVLNGCRLGIIGEPSDWLISSEVDRDTVKSKLGADLIDIPMRALLDTLASIPEQSAPEDSEVPQIHAALPGAYRIYLALKSLVVKHNLNGLTLRCFDLLDAVHNTGCWALAKLNAEGLVAGCEGDVPTMLTMMLFRTLTGNSSFQANPASINPETGEILFAHCTIPFDMVHHYELDTHYESGIGVGIRGHVPEGPVTICKVAGDLSRAFVAEGELIRNQAKPDLCRTQLLVRLAHPSDTEYLLTKPIGNHHVIAIGHHAAALRILLQRCSINSVL